MVNAKRQKIANVSKTLVFVYLVLFPFGQLLRFDTSFSGVHLTIHPIDIVVGLSIPFYVLGFIRVPSVYKQFLGFMSVATFSLVISLSAFDLLEVFVGSFYLIRLFAYSTFFLMVWNLVKKDLSYKRTLFYSLILVCVCCAIFGWIQYFWIPDLRFLTELHWDDHLNRLAGTFLDPSFTSLILVFGFLMSLSVYLRKQRKVLLTTMVFLIVTIAFTYTRASFLALVAGICMFLYWQKKRVVVFSIIVVFAMLVIFLPRPAGEGVRLERSRSIVAKLENYRQTLRIVKLNPLFGVGFNNMCPARLQLYSGSARSHACSGTDSSILFVLATTGVVGSVVFFNFAKEALGKVGKGVYGKALLACIMALLVHSLFVNSMFYPWIIGWMAVLFGISMKSAKE